LFFGIRNDPRLAWNVTANNGTEVVMLNLKKIWVPDTIVMNSGDGDGYLKINADFSYVPVYYDGTVYFASSLIGLKTRCFLLMKNYPVLKIYFIFHLIKLNIF
jgi:hypothetical protein